MRAYIIVYTDINTAVHCHRIVTWNSPSSLSSAREHRQNERDIWVNAFWGRHVNLPGLEKERGKSSLRYAGGSFAERPDTYAGEQVSLPSGTSRETSAHITAFMVM